MILSQAVWSLDKKTLDIFCDEDRQVWCMMETEEQIHSCFVSQNAEQNGQEKSHLDESFYCICFNT